VRVDRVELRRVSLPLVAPFAAAWGTEIVRDLLLVRVEGPDAAGWGECAALSQPLYWPEYTDEAEAVTAAHLAPRLVGQDVAGEAVVAALAPVKGHPMAKAALEMAVLDAELAAAGRPLSAFLGGVRSRVPAGVAVGLVRPLGALLDAVAGYLEAGYRRVKLKIEPGWDVEPVRAVRERFGDDLVLQADANGAYALDDAHHLARLDPFGLALLEQPLGEHDLVGHARLARMVRTPIGLDEAITSAAAASEAVARGACAAVCVKAGRVGGLLEARRVHDVCAAAGVPLWVGGMLESGLARAANVALATLPGFTVPGDLSASDRYWHQDLTEPFRLEDGQLAVPTGPGLGVSPDSALLAEVTTSVREVRAG
jgi:O-succinylbenzoate synthase